MDRKQLIDSLEAWKQTSKKRHARLLRVRALYARAHKAVVKRRAQLRKLDAQKSELKKFLHLCVIHTGETEVGFSNTGKHIDKWEAACGLKGQPYCALFLMYQYAKATGRKLSCTYAYTPNILNAAKRGTDFTLIPRGQERAGDWVLYNFGSSAPVQHVAAITRVIAPGDNETIEGNTSPGTGGSQDNGGGVFIRRRHGAGVVAYVRPVYK